MRDNPMKKILSVILACCLVSACGRGRQEPPLKEEIENPGVPAEMPQKTDAPFLSLNKTWTVVLGIGLAVSIIANVGGLGWMLWVKTRKITKQKLKAAVDAPGGSLPEEASPRKMLDDLRTQLRTANMELNEMRSTKSNISIENLESWIAVLRRYAQAALVNKTISPISPELEECLRQIAIKDVKDFKKQLAPPFPAATEFNEEEEKF